MENIIIAFLTGVAGPLIVLFVRNFLDQRKASNDLVTDAIEVSNTVTEKIDAMREEFSADRVWISQFHNGGHFYPTGKSIAKFSIFFETVNTNTISIQSNFQNIPVNLFSKSINSLLENGKICIPDFDDDTLLTYGLKYAADANICKSQYQFAIETINGKFIGILGVDFTKSKVNLSRDEINRLTNYAASLGGVLMNHLSN
jgi:hypothetical protein